MREGREDEGAGRRVLMGGITTQRKEKGDEVKITAQNETFWIIYGFQVLITIFQRI